MTTKTLTRDEVIRVLMVNKLGENVGLGGYTDTAAYKLCNGDISSTTAGLSDDVRAAVIAASEMGLDWEDYGY